ncbi:biotin--[acetyl-CoA-carboxylase] ligase, partial [Candidatus Bathyarchaeota archaeon]
KGRLGRTWISPRGGLYFSIILKPKIRVGDAVKLVFVASLAVAETLRDLYGLNAETKWPNDVLVDGKKVCGILAEMSSMGEHLKFVVLGVGVNANFNVREKFPKKLQKTATSLQEVLDRKVESMGKSFLKNCWRSLKTFTLVSCRVVLCKFWKSGKSLQVF